MKVLILSHMYPNSMSGIYGVFVEQQAKALAEYCEVKVISPVPWSPFPIRYLKDKWKRYSQIPEKEDRKGIEVFYPRYLTFPKSILFEKAGWFYYLGIKRLVRKIYESFKFDIIYSHTALPDGCGAGRVNKYYNKPLVVTVHGNDIYNTVKKNRKRRKVVEKVFNNADAIITVSRKLSGLTSGYCNDNEKIKSIDNGINIKDVFSGESKLKAKYYGKKILLSVAYLIARKGIDFSIRALFDVVKEIPDVILLVIGDGVERGKLESLAAELNLREQVEFLGGKTHQEVMEYMSICDVFVLPSRNEAFGMVYLEAMINRKPVIACEGEGIEDVIVNNENGVLVKPEDVTGLAAAMSRLLKDREFSGRIAGNAENTVRAGFTWEINAGKLIEVFKEVRENGIKRKNQQ